MTTTQGHPPFLDSRLESQREFANLAKSRKRPGPEHDAEVASGKRRQELIRALLDAVADEMGDAVINDRDAFLKTVRDTAKAAGARLSAPELKAIVAAVGKRDPNATICTDKNGDPESDPELRDTETVPLNEVIDDYMAREVLPHVPDAWVDHTKTKIGYAIPLNRHFFIYEPPRPLNEIEADLQTFEDEIARLLAEITDTEGVVQSLRIKDSEVKWLGDVPEHWDVMQLGRLGSFFKGGGGTKEDEIEGGVPCIRYGDLYTQHQYLIEHSRAGIADASTDKYRPLKYGDILFAGSGETIEEIGKSAVNLIQGPAYCGGDVIGFRPSTDADATFFGYATDSPSATYQKACMGRGVTVMHIYSSELKHLLIPLPPIKEQQAIAAFLDHQTDRIDNLTSRVEAVIERLQEYRTALVASAVTGQIDVRNFKPVGTGDSAA